MPDQGGQRAGPDLGRSTRHDDDLQEHVRQLRRRTHHQTGTAMTALSSFSDE